MGTEFKVGQRSLAFEDSTRANWTGTGPRPLLTEIWYPATDEAVPEDVLFGGPEPCFRLRPVARDAPLRPAPDRLPVVLLSHGTGGAALQMGWLGRYLAARGYVAAAVNHHGNTTIEPYMAQGFLLWWERATDLTVVLDRLLELPELDGRLDTDRIAVAGFSLGGYTAVTLVGGRCSLAHFRAQLESPDMEGPAGPPEFPDVGREWARLEATDAQFRASVARHDASYRDVRVRAALVLNPALGNAFAPDGLAGIDVPVHVVCAAGDTVAPPAANGERYARLIANAALTRLDGEAGHYVFLAEATEAGRRLAPELCRDAEPVDRAAVHQQVGGLAVNFFDRHLADVGPRAAS